VATGSTAEPPAPNLIADCWLGIAHHSPFAFARFFAFAVRTLALAAAAFMARAPFLGVSWFPKEPLAADLAGPPIHAPFRVSGKWRGTSCSASAIREDLPMEPRALPPPG
jgi:hypothetical protein